jgi:adenylate cyclase
MRPSGQEADVPADGSERRLAAILAADVAGYSRLMGADEAGTLVALKAHRRELIDPQIAAHKGRIVKTTGDGMLAEFPSVVEAVACAVAVQQGMAARNGDVPPERCIQFRVGINLGDVIVEEGDIFGDGVNVAARLEALAEPGGILLSRAAHEQVKGKLGFAFADLGEKRLKNIAEPVRVWRWRADGEAKPGARPKLRAWHVAAGLMLLLAAGAVGLWLRAPPPSAPVQADAASKPAVAVLPFDNLSDDPAQSYFSDGFTEDLITDLSKVSGLLVIARNSTFAYKGRHSDLRDVGRALGARYVVEGSVRKAGPRVRITAQLIDAVSGHHVWAERYDRDLTDLFAVQDDVRQRIVAALAVHLTPSEKERLGQRPTSDLEAYDAWLRGLEHVGRFTREDNEAARRYFTFAAERDPKFARAIGQIANTHSMDVQMGWSADRETSERLAVLAARQAVALDGTLPEARYTLSTALARAGRLDEALAEAQKAIDLNPNYADGLAWRAAVLAGMNRGQEALQEIERAMRLNPHFRYWHIHIRGIARFALGEYDMAVADFRLALERNPNWHPSRWLLAATLGHLGRRTEAEWELNELHAAGIRLDRSNLGQANLATGDSAYRARITEGLRKAGLAE